MVSPFRFVRFPCQPLHVTLVASFFFYPFDLPPSYFPPPLPFFPVWTDPQTTSVCCFFHHRLGPIALSVAPKRDEPSPKVPLFFFPVNRVASHLFRSPGFAYHESREHYLAAHSWFENGFFLSRVGFLFFFCLFRRAYRAGFLPLFRISLGYF